MNVAVFYTGCLRTFEKTHPHNINNLFIQKDPNVKIHIFACIQNDTHEPDNVVEQKLVKMFSGATGDPLLRSIKWFDNNNEQFQEWKNARVDSLDDAEVSEGWKHYLKNSGSITEYVQYSQCWIQMVQYEAKTGNTFNYVVRLRTDIVVASPLDFSLLPTTKKTQQGLMDWLSLERRQQGRFIEINEFVPETDEIQDSEKWLLSIRKNMLYIMPMTTAEIISRLGDFHGTRDLYGTLKPKTESQHGRFIVWMDAESQLQLVCLQNGVVIIDSTTHFEVKSVYEFKRNIYFDYDENGEYLIPSPQYAAFAYR